MGPCFLWGKILNTCAILLLGNDRKCKYILCFWKYIQHARVNWVIKIWIVCGASDDTVFLCIVDVKLCSDQTDIFMNYMWCFKLTLNSLWPSDNIWWQIWVNIGPGNGLLPDGTKPLPETMLTSHHQHLKTSCTGRAQDINSSKEIGKYIRENYFHIFLGSMS